MNPGALAVLFLAVVPVTAWAVPCTEGPHPAATCEKVTPPAGSPVAPLARGGNNSQLPAHDSWPCSWPGVRCRVTDTPRGVVIDLQAATPELAARVRDQVRRLVETKTMLRKNSRLLP